MAKFKQGEWARANKQLHCVLRNNSIMSALLAKVWERNNLFGLQMNFCRKNCDISRVDHARNATIYVVRPLEKDEYGPVSQTSLAADQ